MEVADSSAGIFHNPDCLTHWYGIAVVLVVHAAVTQVLHADDWFVIFVKLRGVHSDYVVILPGGAHRLRFREDVGTLREVGAIKVLCGAQPI
jgi:hypothetical protein